MERIFEPEVVKNKEEALDFSIIAEKRQVHARNFLKKYLRYCSGSRILDVGSGLATLAVYAASLNEKYVIDCIELSDETNKIARENIQKKGLENRINIIKTDAKNMELPSSSYDIVMCHDMLHHVREPVYVINEIVRVSKPCGGILIRDILRPRSQAELERIIMERAEDIGNTNTDKTVRESAIAVLSLEEIKKLAQMSNLKNYKIMEEKRHRGYLSHAWILRLDNWSYSLKGEN